MSGNLPIELFQLVTLTEFSLRSAQFDGIISVDFQNLVNMKILDLSANDFSGNIPPASVWSAMINLGKCSLVVFSQSCRKIELEPHRSMLRFPRETTSKQQPQIDWRNKPSDLR